MSVCASSRHKRDNNIETHHTRRAAETRCGQPLSSRNHEVASHRYSAATIDWPLLHWLLRCPFLSAEDMAAFCGMSHSTTTRRLAELEDRGFVEWVASACLVHSGTQRLYHLSNAGINLLATSLETDATKLARTWECDENRLLQQLPRLAHLVRVQSLIRGLLLGAPQAFGEQGHEASGAWHWVRNYHHSFPFRSRSQTLKLDAAVVFHVTRVSEGGHSDFAKFTNKLNITSNSSLKPGHWEARDTWYAALLLAGTPLQDWHVAARTLDTLISYRESPERWPVYDEFPPLLLLAENERHAQRWQQLARSCADLRLLTPLRGAIAVVPQPPRLPHSFDAWRLPWRDLVTGVPCHLAQVMSRLSHDAVPPNSDGSDAPKPLSARKQTIIVAQPYARVVFGRFNERTLSVAGKQDQSNAHAGVLRDALRLRSLQLGGRLTEILTLLLRVPGIQVVDLADLFGVQHSSMDRYLSELDRYGLLTHCRDATHTIGDRDRGNNAIQQSHLSYDPSTSVWLSDMGHWLATATQRVSPRSKQARRVASRHPRHDQGGWIPTIHNLGVYHFFALLTDRANIGKRHLAQEPAQRPRHHLIWWEAGILAERRYCYHGRWHYLRPDGAGCFQGGDKLFHFWLEWDQGSMNLSDLICKFMSYETYLASGAWRETDNRVIPHLLIVAQSFGQIRRMRKAVTIASVGDMPIVHSASGGMPLTASITLANRIDESGPTAPIWWPLFPASSSYTLSAFTPFF